MKTYKITYSNGDYNYTKANGTEEDVRRYFLGTVFNIGIERDLLVKCINVEVVED